MVRKSAVFGAGAAAVISAVTGMAAQGPQLPEFKSFSGAEQIEPIELFTGDFRYRIPVVELPTPGGGTFPLSLGYQSGISPDDEASWVGLGWTLNPGSINRQLRGLPDDYKGDVDCGSLASGDCISTTEDIEPNWTFGLGLDGNLELVGADTGLGLGLSAGLKGYYNSYRGLGYARSIGLSGQASANGIAGSVGLNLSNDSQQGFRASPSLSVADMLSFNAAYDSAAGLSALNFSTSYRNHLIIESDLLNFGGYARPTYFPDAGRDMTGWNIQVSVKGGGEIQGVYANLQASGFYNVEQVKDPDERFNRAVGYLNLEQARDAVPEVRDRMVLDFNREKDGAIYDDSPNLAIPVLTNDIFSLAGPNLAGSFRAYRNDVPWVYDPKQTTELLGGAVGFDVGGGLIAKFGGSFSINGTKGSNGGWDGGDGGALVAALKAASPANPSADFERTYFKLIGESVPRAPGALLPGDDAPVAVPIKAAPFDITNLPPDYFEAEASLTTGGNARLPITIDGSKRAPRGTLIEPFTNAQLDGNPGAFPEFAVSRTQLYAQRRAGHIGGFRVTDTAGMRYVYAIPVYNMVHEEHRFSVKRENFVAGSQCQLMTPPTSGGEYQYKTDHTEQYRHVKKLSPYAVSWLLTAVIGPDYVDADGVPGPSEGDYGYWVRLDYDKKSAPFAWRRPFHGAEFIRGLDNGPYVVDAQRRGDKAFFSYGEREEWYLSRVESRTHVARFHLGARQDSFAAANRVQTAATAPGRATQRLERVELFARDLKRPENQWRPLQTVRFQYDYSLQRGAPGASAAGGRLSLRKVWTEFERNTRGAASAYEFDYEAGDAANNPAFVANSTDRWGSFQPLGRTLTPNECVASGGAGDPTLAATRGYVDQARAADTRDRQSAAWSLRRIVEPSGREVTVEYESDDYALVQDHDAMVMTRLVAVSNPDSATPATIDKRSRSDAQAHDALRVYFAAPPGLSAQSARNQLVRQGGRVYYRVRIALKDAATWETVSGYANVADAGTFTANDGRVLAWVELERVQGFHPFSVAAWQHLRLIQPQLMTESAINGDPNADPFSEALKFLTLADFIEEIVAMIQGIYPTWFDRNWGQQVDLENSFVRLRVPSGVKYGGGSRVRGISYRDRWSAATANAEPDLVTGYRYEYRLPDGRSSGVASYEPAEGADENSMRDALPFTQKVLLTSSYNLFAETPFAEAYYPAPTVGYSRVTVRSLASEMARERARQGQVPTRTSTLGPAVHEFYTAANFPVRSAETPLVKKRNPQPWMVPIPFLGQITLNSLAATQGYSVTLNDMHGKPRRVSRYEYGLAWNAQTQDFELRALPDTSTEYFYRATGGSGGTPFTLDPRLPAFTGDATRDATDPVFAREAELFIDTRRNRTESFDAGLNVNVDLTYALFPIPLVVPMPSLAYSLTEAKTAVAMKVVHQAGMLDRIVERKGPAEQLRENRVLDPLSGRPLLSVEHNEFGDPVFDYRMPARWKYPRMGAAYPSVGLRLPLSGARLVGTDLLVVGAPAIPACDDTTTRATTCLPLGSRFAVGQGAGARGLVLESATASELSLRAHAPLNAVPGGDAVLVASGDANLLELDTGRISALSDPTTGRTPVNCRWTTTKACGVCYVKEVIVEPSCQATAWIESLGGLDKKVGVKSCPDGLANIGLRADGRAIGYVARQARGKRNQASRQCQVIIVDKGGNPVDENLIEAAGNASVGSSAPAPQVNGVPYSGVSFEARVGGTRQTLFVYSDCDGWIHETSRQKPLVDYCDVEHQQTRTRVKDVLSASATLYSDTWPSVAEEVRFAGTREQIERAQVAYEARNGFARGERGIWRPSREYAYVENRRQSANVDVRRDGAFDLTLFDWSDPDNPVCAPQWRWQSQVTRYGPSGDEVEEISPIGGYSAALYGHVQRVPIALAGNAAHGEIAAESFEGYKPDESVSALQSGEGNIQFYTIATREQVRRICPADLVVRGYLDGQILRLRDDDIAIRGDGVARKWAQLDDARLASGRVRAEIPGIRCPLPVAGSSLDERGRQSLVLEPLPGCPLPPSAPPLDGTRIALDDIGIRLILPCDDAPQYVPVRHVEVTQVKAHTGMHSLAISAHHDFHQPDLSLVGGKRYVISAWFSRDNTDVPTYQDIDTSGLQVRFWQAGQEMAAARPALLRPEGPVIDGWQRMQGTFTYPANAEGLSIAMQNGADRGAPRAFFDDLRVVPEDGRLETFIYDPANLRVVARLDGENYAKVFSYHPDGSLAQTQQETDAGKLTVIEARMHAGERP